MLPDRVSNPGPLTYESGALPIALRGPAFVSDKGSTPKFHINLVWQQILFRLQNSPEKSRHSSFNKLKIGFTHTHSQFLQNKESCHNATGCACEIFVL